MIMHHRIHDARDIWGANSPQEMLSQRIVSLAKRGISVLVKGDGTPARRDVLDFYVSDGRWVATCPECNGGVVHFPDTPWAICPDCGRGYGVRFPAQKSRIEARLLERPVHNRQLLPGWSLEELEAEIAQFGLAHRSWTAPRTWVSSELITAAIGNTHWRDNLLMTGPALVTTAGDIIYATGANALARLGIGSANQIPRTNSGATAPEWVSLPDTIVILSGHLETTGGYFICSPRYTHVATGFDIRLRSYGRKIGTGNVLVKLYDDTTPGDVVINTHTGDGHIVSSVLTLTAGRNYEIQIATATGGQQVFGHGELIIDVY